MGLTSQREDMKPEEKQVIELKVTDNCFERARKILICGGLIDCSGLASRIAESIEAYRIMDNNQPKERE
jgi:hypothetical protein